MKALILTGILAGVALANGAPFRDGERAALYGDSVTHHGYYVKPLQDFYYTRFPEADIHIWNCGVGGETAGEAIRRFEVDIASRQPTFVSVLFGQNDVGVVGYQTNAPDWAVSQRTNAVKNFSANMRIIQGLLRERLPHAQVTWCTLVPWDDELKFKKPRGPITGVTAGERPLCDFVTALQREAGGGYIDFYAPMLAYNRKLHAQDPYTSLSPDTIHPREPGGLFMTQLFLRSQGVDGCVSDVVLDAAAGKATRVQNADVANCARTLAGGLIFLLKEKALPFPVEPAAKELAADVGFDAEFNRETLAVTGLAEGRWTLRIDGTNNVLTASAAAWAKGVNLALCEATPMMAQARRVAALNAEKCAKEKAVRDMWVARCVAFRRMQWEVGLKMADYADDSWATAFIHGFLNACGKEPHKDRALYANYAKNWRSRDRMEREIEELHRRIRQINRPSAHTFELAPAN